MTKGTHVLLEHVSSSFWGSGTAKKATDCCAHIITACKGLHCNSNDKNQRNGAWRPSPNNLKVIQVLIQLPTSLCLMLVWEQSKVWYIYDSRMALPLLTSGPRHLTCFMKAELMFPRNKTCDTVGVFTRKPKHFSRTN